MTDYWQDHAACKGQNISMFFPGTGLRSNVIEKFCSVCPVSGPCLNEGLQSARTSGIWGGTTQNQRVKIIGSY